MTTFCQLNNIAVLRVRSYMRGIPASLLKSHVKIIEELFEESLRIKISSRVKEIEKEVRQELLDPFINKKEVKNYDTDETLETFKGTHRMTGRQLRHYNRR